jgi:hypothetical protein
LPKALFHLLAFVLKPWHRLVFLLASFGPISVLLGHLYNLGPMVRLFIVIEGPATALMVFAWRRSVTLGDQEFRLSLRSGLVGGVIGTLGYDLVRIPMHLFGFNPLSPIRFYGVWITGVDHATWLTDLAGLGYHFFTGVTFAWMYAIVALRCNWLWAVAWALGLESLAVASVFGEVFALRGAYDVLALAFAAHLFYGGPLGVVCQHPERSLAWFTPLARAGGAWITGFVLVLFAAWFCTAWQPLRPIKHVRAREIIVGPDALYPGLIDIGVDSDVLLRNEAGASVNLLHRSPGTAEEKLTIDTSNHCTLQLRTAGIHQLLTADKPWRSIFIAVRRNGDYRPEMRK